MSSFSSIDISASGLFAQRTRLDAIANNIANVNTTRTDTGGPYKKQEVVFRSRTADDGTTAGVDVEEVVESQAPSRMIHDPSNPDANSEGMVAMPNVNIVEEMVDMVSATRAYEANVQAIQAAKSMASKALELGRA
ncbi:MAG: flagellar basal body rod protein FlgC [Armatimonadota bacterium]